jgi:hypothetical protein
MTRSARTRRGNRKEAHESTPWSAFKPKGYAVLTGQDEGGTVVGVAVWAVVVIAPERVEGVVVCTNTRP